MTENKENWLYSDASGLYFVHDGFIMRATDGKQYDIEEECDLLNELSEESEHLKKENKFLRCTIESNSQDDYIDYLEKQNERLKERITELASNDKIVFVNG